MAAGEDPLRLLLLVNRHLSNGRSLGLPLFLVVCDLGSGPHALQAGQLVWHVGPGDTRYIMFGDGIVFIPTKHGNEFALLI